MQPIHLDPDQGRHAAAELTNEALEAACDLLLWELALRTDEQEFARCLRGAIERYAESGAELAEARQERDLMRFAAEVMIDIQRLPVLEDPNEAPSTGMYL